MDREWNCAQLQWESIRLSTVTLLMLLDYIVFTIEMSMLGGLRDYL